MSTKTLKPVAGHLLGPFSTPKTYYAPKYKGFMGVPRNNIHVPGWGEPYTDSYGKPITPGTFGGPNQAALVRKEKGHWRLKRHKRAQKFGEISWRGPKKGDKPNADRYVISYHGPTTRHFGTPFFVYGSDGKHRNVYMEGGMLGIAPGPVLGGCLKSISNRMHLIVVCLIAGEETVLQRVVGSPVYGEKEEDLTKLAQYASEDFPNGWRVIAIVTTGDDYETVNTPWFFNESGTEAQCIRYKQKDGVFNGEVRKERAGDRFKLVISGVSAASTVSLGNLPAYAFKETGTHTDKGDWISPPDSQGYPHKWRELNLNVRAECKGEQVVAVDYDGDTEILAKVVIDTSYSMNQDYMCGKDEDLYSGIPLGDEPHYRNWIDNPPGFRYANPLNLGVDPTKTVGNHEGGCWWSGGAHTYLSFTKGGTEYRITLEVADTLTQEEYLGLPRSPTNNIIFLRYYEIQYVRFLDMRAGGLVCTRMETYEHWAEQDTVTQYANETFDTDFSDKLLNVILEGSKTYSEMTPTYHPRLARHPDYVMRATWEIVSGLGRPGTPGWTFGTWEWEATTWIGARPDNNDDAQIGNLPVNSWFPEQSTLYRKSWYGLKVLFHDKNTESASFCQREDKTFILSGELPHPDSGEPTNFLVTKPEDIASAIDGPVYFPIGEL